MHRKLSVFQKTRAGASYQTRVNQVTAWDEDGNPSAWHPVTEWSDPDHNLILPGGLTANFSWTNLIRATSLYSKCHVGTGNTPNKAVLAGTFQQSGTTVTRASGAGVFASGNVNDFIKFGTGEIAKIVSFTNTLTVEVDRSQTVAAAALTVYDTSRTLLDAWEKTTTTTSVAVGASGITQNTEAGTTTWWNTFQFATETVPKVYAEVGMATASLSTSPLWSRVVLASTVAVDVGQFLEVRVTLIATLVNYRTAAAMAVNITGWPRPYAISSITPGTAGGTAFDIVVAEACSSHYAVGRPIIVTGALPPTTAIASIASTGSDFTVTTSGAHGKSPGDSVVIAGASPSGYNGTWTAASGTTGSTLVVTSGINPGAGTGGTVRLSTPGTWYDGTWTIASFPNSTTIRVTNNTITVPAGAVGNVTNSLAASAIVSGYAHADGASSTIQGGPAEPAPNQSNSESKALQLWAEASMKSSLQYGVEPSSSSGYVTGSRILTATNLYTASTRTLTQTFLVPSSAGVSQTIRQIQLQCNGGSLWITFDERQRKDDGYTLSVTFSNTWEPVLD